MKKKFLLLLFLSINILLVGLISSASDSYGINWIIGNYQQNNSVYLTISPSEEVNYGTETTVECTSDYGTPKLYLDGNEVTSPNIRTFAVGSYEYICNVSSGDTWVSNSTTKTLTVSKVSPGLTITSSNGFSITVGESTIITGNNCPEQLTCDLFFNDTWVDNPYNTGIIGAGSYPIVFNTTGNANYTSQSLSRTLTVTAGGTTTECNYKKFGYYNLKLPWFRETNCI